MTNTHFDSMDDVRDVESINFYNKLIAKGKKPEKALRIINGGSRDHGRTPMQWTAEPGSKVYRQRPLDRNQQECRALERCR